MAYNKRKKKFSFLGLFITAMALMLCVGALGWLSKGFRDWKVKDWLPEKETTESIILDI